MSAKVRLCDKPIPAKSRPAGLAFLKSSISSLIPSVAAHLDGFNHHLCDATIAAYTAYLYWRGKAEPVGDVGEGIIWLPLFDRQLQLGYYD